jgi:hypothetical protein
LHTSPHQAKLRKLAHVFVFFRIILLCRAKARYMLAEFGSRLPAFFCWNYNARYRLAEFGTRLPAFLLLGLFDLSGCLGPHLGCIADRRQVPTAWQLELHAQHVTLI